MHSAILILLHTSVSVAHSVAHISLLPSNNKHGGGKWWFPGPRKEDGFPLLAGDCPRSMIPSASALLFPPPASEQNRPAEPTSRPSWKGPVTTPCSATGGPNGRLVKHRLPMAKTSGVRDGCCPPGPVRTPDGTPTLWASKGNHGGHVPNGDDPLVIVSNPS